MVSMVKSGIVKLIKAKCRVVVDRSWGGENVETLVKSYQVLLVQDKWWNSHSLHNDYR